tara:strand:- start:1033 stop:1263 length:231 start_codon:yes stop_codon:yes gene_type:complete
MYLSLASALYNIIIRIFARSIYYYYQLKLDITHQHARLSKLTKVPDEDVVELGRKITVLSPCNLDLFLPRLLTVLM